MGFGMVHGFRYFGGVTESVLTDRMKTVLLSKNRLVLAPRPDDG
jgi:transposase